MVSHFSKEYTWGAGWTQFKSYPVEPPKDHLKNNNQRIVFSPTKIHCKQLSLLPHSSSLYQFIYLHIYSCSISNNISVLSFSLSWSLRLSLSSYLSLYQIYDLCVFQRLRPWLKNRWTRRWQWPRANASYSNQPSQVNQSTNTIGQVWSMISLVNQLSK